MDLIKQKIKKKDELKRRVLSCRSDLISIGVKNPIDKFSIKYPEYAINKKTIHRLNNLWYGKITDQKFTIKLESFVVLKKNEF